MLWNDFEVLYLIFGQKNNLLFVAGSMKKLIHKKNPISILLYKRLSTILKKLLSNKGYREATLL